MSPQTTACRTITGNPANNPRHLPLPNSRSFAASNPPRKPVSHPRLILREEARDSTCQHWSFSKLLPEVTISNQGLCPCLPGCLKCLSALSSSIESTPSAASGHRRLSWLDALVKRWPFSTLLLLIFVSNVFGSVFNIGYNRELIINRLMNEQQQAVFHNVAFPLYNMIVYPIGLGDYGMASSAGCSQLSDDAPRPIVHATLDRVGPTTAGQLAVLPGLSQLALLASGHWLFFL